MNETFLQIVELLNTPIVDDSNVYTANYDEQSDTITVVNAEIPDATVFISHTDNQILMQTPLFSESEIADSEKAELNRKFLNISPVMPLSSIGINGGMYILFGSMPVTTTVSDIVGEVKTQINNYPEVLIASEDHLLA